MLRQIEAVAIADELLKKHNLHWTWKIQWNKSEKHLGQCWFDQKVIAISVYMLNSSSEAEFKDTVLHEIAHALVGYEANHGPVWKAKALEIGCTSNECGQMSVDKSRSITTAEQKEKTHVAPITNICPNCGKTAIEVKRMTMAGATWLKLACNHLVKKDLIQFNPIDAWTSASGKQLYEYQKKGIEFIISANGRALVADEPGLGKTVQAQGFLYFKKDIATPALWVCKTTLKLQATMELLDWCGDEWMPQIIETSKDFIMPGLKLYIISMDMLRRFPVEKLQALGIKTIIADEIQHFKNPDSARTQELRRLVNAVDFFIPLSGTPWKNRGSEYFAVLNMLAPERFPSYNNFQHKWVEWEYDNRSGKTKQGGIRNIKEFREHTKDFIIRRMRDDVLPDLPKINRQIRYVELEDIYGESYEKAEAKVAEIIKNLVLEGSEASRVNIAAEIMKLKHITGLAKVDAQVEDAIQFLEGIEEWQKLTIAHHHIDVGDDLENKLNKWLLANGYNKAIRLYGGENPHTRYAKEQEFKQDIKNRLMIVSTLAAGEGLNLQFCQNASLMERQWNPQNEQQFELRFSRPLNYNEYPAYLQEHLFDSDHQPKKVSIRVPYLICGGTIDEMLTEIVERKRLNYNKSMNPGDEDLKWEENDIMKELADAILKKRYGKK